MTTLFTRRLVAQILLVMAAVAAIIMLGADLSHATTAMAPRDPIPPWAPNPPSLPTLPDFSGQGADGASSVNISVGGKPSTTITLILAITVLSVAPSLLLLATSFTKIDRGALADPQRARAWPPRRRTRC